MSQDELYLPAHLAIAEAHRHAVRRAAHEDRDGDDDQVRDAERLAVRALVFVQELDRGFTRVAIGADGVVAGFIDLKSLRHGQQPGQLAISALDLLGGGYQAVFPRLVVVVVLACQNGRGRVHDVLGLRLDELA